MIDAIWRWGECGGCYLNLIEGVGHHGYEHVDKDYDGHAMVSHQEELPHQFGEGFNVFTISHCAQWREAKEGPEQITHTVTNAAREARPTN